MVFKKHKLITEEEFIEEVENSDEFVKELLRTNPRFLNFIFPKNAIRKYVKIPIKYSEKLKQMSEEKNVAEGTLIGLAIILFLQKVEKW